MKNRPLEILSTSQKIQLIEALWADLINNDSIESPDWHQPILEERYKAYKEGNAKTISFDELNEHINV